jgi:hypothetical protein
MHEPALVDFLWASMANDGRFLNHFMAPRPIRS